MTNLQEKEVDKTTGKSAMQELKEAIDELGFLIEKISEKETVKSNVIDLPASTNNGQRA